MKMKFCFCLCFFFVLIGCASVKKSVDAIELCRNDEACYARMVKNGNVAVDVVRSTNAESWLELVAFNLVSALSGVLLGRKMVKRG